ncbi:MAG: valine--tRNA ligase [Candidatus Limnocylindria bacterium]
MTDTREAPPQSALTYAEKNFKPAVVESDLYSWWERSGFFEPNDSEKTFVMMLPLPNITGDLHLGHALGFGGYEDLMARWHRMLGESTLYMPGTDHAGIIAQIVVEKELAKEGVGRDGLGREEFLAEMWKWMDHYRPRIEQQLRMLGCSLDWSRPNFTMEPSKQRAVRIHFIRLYKEGLLYRADRIVHWCLTCQTTYSDLEALHVERADTLSYVRYPWADGAGGAPDLVVATTRPETILADVAVAVHPDDERWKPYIGREVLVPVVERRVKVIADEAVDPAFGTGALKITPGHDATDFEIGQRHHLPVLTVIGKDGLMQPAAGPLAGLDRDSARKDMVERLRKGGLLIKEEPMTHSVGIHDRCETVEEPLVLPQWWVRMKPLAEPAIAAVRSGRVRIVPEFQARIYFDWMENIRDWAVSRQIWWGHEIPVWYCRDCTETIVPDEDGPDPTRCRKCRSDDLRKDPDVLDTWFSSCLWPFSTLGWPDRKRDLERFYPGTVLETGYDILFFWVARMIVMGIHHMGDVPFRTVYLHGLVRTGGRKMSKSKGNVESPVGIVEEYGADALRFGLVLDSAAGMDMQISEGKLTNARQFANKLWNVGRFVLRQVEAHPDALAGRPVDARPDGDLHEAERWILSRTERAVAEATRLLEAYLFGEYAHLLQQFVWGELADAYVELAKAGTRDERRRVSTVRTLAYSLDRVLRLLHPVMPFITETLALQLWRGRRTSRDEASMVVARWPEAGERDEGLEARFEVALEVVRAIRSLRQEAGIDPSQRVTATLGADTKAVSSSLDVIAALASADVSLGGGQGPATIVRMVEVRISVRRDPAAERSRLERELADARASLARTEELLGTPDFAAKAPPKVVETARSRLTERRERVRLVQEELERT